MVWPIYEILIATVGVETIMPGRPATRFSSSALTHPGGNVKNKKQILDNHTMIDYSTPALNSSNRAVYSTDDNISVRWLYT